MLCALLVLCQAPASPHEAGARIEFGIVVHPENPAESISTVELRRILRAEVQEWPTRESIQLLLPRSGSGEKQALLQLVYDMNDLQLKRYWTRLIYENRIVQAPLSVPSPMVALRTLERTRGALTIVPAQALRGLDCAKVLAIDGLRPGQAGYVLWLESATIVQAGEQAPRRATEASYRPEDEAPRGDDERELLERVKALEQALLTAPREDAPTLNWRLFGHLESEYETDTTAGEPASNLAFSLEILDLLTTSALTERLSVLSETVFEALDENEFDIEVERLILKYRFSDALTLEGGRFLSTLGYWNSKYHHGEWLQTSIDRPEVLNFEGDDGLLPLHGVGLALKGAWFGRQLSTEYALELSNGRGRTPGDTQDKLDANDDKALNCALALQASALPGFRLGGGLYLDDIPRNTDPDEGSLHGSLDERITNLNVSFEDSRWEAMAEYFLIEHDGAGVDADSSGWYLQVGRRYSDFVPYLRIDAAERDDQDPFWGVFEDTSTVALGVRYDPTRWLALTLQYERTDIDAPPGEENGRTNTVVLQATF